MQGASPLAAPRLNPGGTGFSFGKQCPKGGLSPGLPAGSAVPVPEGGLPALSPAYHAICLPFFPHPPVRARRALFPAGRGRPRLFHARGFAPCSPEAEPGRHGLFLWKTVPQGGACPRGCRLALLYRRPRGGVFRLACLPCHLFTVFPHPPVPLPLRGRGRLKVISCKGLRPLHPRHLTACGTYRACQAGTRRRESPRLGAKSTEPPFYWRCRQPRRGGTGGDGTIRRKRRRRLRWSSPPGQGEPMPHGYKPDSKPTAEAAKPILQSPKSQPPSDTAREP